MIFGFDHVPSISINIQMPRSKAGSSFEKPSLHHRIRRKSFRFLIDGVPTSEIRHPDLNQYIVVYNPKWSEQQQLWNFAQCLGEIILYYCYKDADKHVYTGDITIQEIETQTELPLNYLFSPHSHSIEQYLKACQDAKDITDILQTHFLSKHQQLRFLYDTPSETVLYLGVQADDSPIKQYLLHIPRICQ